MCQCTASPSRFSDGDIHGDSMGHSNGDVRMCEQHSFAEVRDELIGSGNNLETWARERYCEPARV